jgi:hypothetical protein
MQVTKVFTSKPSNISFEVASHDNANIIDEISKELDIFRFKSQLTHPSPRKYPSAIRLIGASHYWSNGMVWACLSGNTLILLLIPDKQIKTMTEYEYEDYQQNYDLQNAVVEHFMQIAMRKT